MSLKDKISEEKNEYVLKGQLAQEEIQKKVSRFEGMESDLDVELKASFDAGFDSGLAQAGQANGTDKIYSEQEWQEEFGKYKAELDTLKAENEALKASKEVEISDAVAVAVSAKEVALKAEFFNELTSVSLDDAALKQKYAPQSEVTV